MTDGVGAAFGGLAMYAAGVDHIFQGYRTMTSGYEKQGLYDTVITPDGANDTLTYASNGTPLADAAQLSKEGFRMEFIKNTSGELTNKVKLFGSNDGVSLAGFKRGTRLVGYNNYQKTILGANGYTTSMNPYALSTTGGILTALSSEYVIKSYTKDWYGGKIDTSQYVSEVGNHFAKVGAVTTTMYNGVKLGSSIRPVAAFMTEMPAGRAVAGGLLLAYGIGVTYDNYIGPHVKAGFQKAYNWYHGVKK